MRVTRKRIQRLARNPRQTAVVLLLLVVLIWLAWWTTPDPSGAEVAVLEIIDGDTIRIRLGWVRTETVPYIGINTPETLHPTKGEESGGRDAMEVNRRLVEGRTVRLETDVERRDVYGRLLAYVWSEGSMINADLVRLGYARVLTLPPNVKYRDLFRRLQREARAERRGLWGRPAPAPEG